jgi:hypothetical protein
MVLLTAGKRTNVRYESIKTWCPRVPFNSCDGGGMASFRNPRTSSRTCTRKNSTLLGCNSTSPSRSSTAHRRQYHQRSLTRSLLVIFSTAPLSREWRVLHCPTCCLEERWRRKGMRSSRPRAFSLLSAGSRLPCLPSREETCRTPLKGLRRRRRGGTGRTGTPGSTSWPSVSGARRCSSSSWRWPPSSQTSPRYLYAYALVVL